MSAPAIVVRNLHKTFRRYHPERPWTIQEALARGLRRIAPVEWFHVLKDVSFEVPAGRTMGIVGANGSGKSTLLRLIGGIGRPTSGEIAANGRIGALLDLGAGFHPDLTGRENAIMSGILSGLTRQEVLARFDSIVAFAEVQEFIDHPIRTYSTGMQMRLAFSTAVHTEPDILLIDEVLSVGDIAFQRKCLDRIAQYKAAGCSIVLVSHESSVIQELCDDAMWIGGGRIVAHGRAADVVRQYVEFMNSDTSAQTGALAAAPEEPVATGHSTVKTDTGVDVVVDERRFGSFELEIGQVVLLDAQDQPIAELHSGQPAQILIDYRASQRLVAPLFRVRILRADGLICYDLNTAVSPLSLETLEGAGSVTLHLDRLDLNGGRYVIDVGCYAPEWAYAYDYHYSVCSFIVRGDAGQAAVLSAPHRWRVGEPGEAPVARPPHVPRVRRS